MATACKCMLALAVLVPPAVGSLSENTALFGDEVSLLQVDPGQVRQSIPSNVDYGTLTDRGLEQLQRQEYVSGSPPSDAYGGLDDPLNLGYQAQRPDFEQVMPGGSMGQEIVMPYSMSGGQLSDLGTSSFQDQLPGPHKKVKGKEEHLENWVKIALAFGVGCTVIGIMVCGYDSSIRWSIDLNVSESHQSFSLEEKRMKYAKAYLEAVRLFGWWPTEDRPGGLLYIKIPKIAAPYPPEMARELVKSNFQKMVSGSQKESTSSADDSAEMEEDEKPVVGILGHHCPKCKTSWRTGYRLDSDASSSEAQGRQGVKRVLTLDPQPPYDTHCGESLQPGVLEPTVENHFYVGIMVGQIYTNLCDMDQGTKLVQRGDALFFLDLLAHTLIVVLIPLQGSFGHNFIDTLLKVIMVVLAVFGTVVKGINQVHQPGDKGKTKLEFATEEYALIRDLASLQGQFAEKWKEKENAKKEFAEKRGDQDKGSGTADSKADGSGTEDAYGTKFIHYPVFVELFDHYMKMSRENAASEKAFSYGDGSSEAKNSGMQQKSVSARS